MIMLLHHANGGRISMDMAGADAADQMEIPRRMATNGCATTMANRLENKWNEFSRLDLKQWTIGEVAWTILKSRQTKSPQ